MEDGRNATRSSRIREHLRTNVVGYIAIFLFAVAGTASALPGRNTVDSGDIKNKQVKRADIRPNAVNGSRVATNALGGGDINEATLEQVPAAGNALNAAALGGNPAAAFARTNPDLTGPTAPFLNEATLNANSANVLDLGFVSMRGTDSGIRICNDIAVQAAYHFVEDYDENTPGALQTLGPAECFNHSTLGTSTVQFAAEFAQGGIYALLLDPDSDDLFRIWWLQ